MAVSLRTYPLGLLRIGASLRGAAGWGEQVSISGGTVGFVHQRDDRASVRLCDAVAADRHRHSPVATDHTTVSQRFG